MHLLGYRCHGNAPTPAREKVPPHAYASHAASDYQVSRLPLFQQPPHDATACSELAAVDGIC